MEARLHEYLRGCAEEAALRAEERLLSDFQRLDTRTEGEIERLMLAALLGQNKNNPCSLIFHTDDAPEHPLIGGHHCYLNAPIKQYRADFLITTKLTDADDLHRIVVECDGHDFHERTKQQARHDRRRDREMTAAGIKVMRFTGSEIWRDPTDCADDVFGLIIDICVAAWRRSQGG